SDATRQLLFSFVGLLLLLRSSSPSRQARRSKECEREASLKSPESSKPEVRLRLTRRIFLF
ncbi:unnamed protein product, partial [Arabidopsis halleri]